MTGLLLMTVFVIWFNIAYNKLQKLNTEAENAYAALDVHLEKRYELVPNIVNIVNGANIGEEELTERVMIMREATWDPGSWAGKVRTETELGMLIDELVAVAEANEKINKTNSFFKFKEQMKDINESIDLAIEHYNEAIVDYNKKIRSFPAIMYAKMLKYKKKAPFEYKGKAAKAE